MNIPGLDGYRTISAVSKQRDKGGVITLGFFSVDAAQKFLDWIQERVRAMHAEPMTTDPQLAALIRLKRTLDQVKMPDVGQVFTEAHANGFNILLNDVGELVDSINPEPKT